MNALRNAFTVVQENLRPLFVYFAFAVAAALISIAARHLFDIGELLETNERRAIAMDAAVGVVLAVLAATAQTLVFARMGRSIDRPLWKLTDGDAFRRFFGVWLFLNGLLVGLMTAARVAHLRGDAQSAAAILQLWPLAALVTLSVGACIMFHGRFSWRELSQALRPLTRQVPEALVVLFFGYFQYAFVLFMAQAVRREFLLPAVYIVAAYLECVLFAGVWVLCMAWRNAMDEEDDGDHEF